MRKVLPILLVAWLFGLTGCQTLPPTPLPPGSPPPSVALATERAISPVRVSPPATHQAYLALVSKPASVIPATPVPAFFFPDSEVVYGPAALDFDIAGYLQAAGGALGGRQEYLASSGWTPAADIVQRVASENSINPRLLLGLLEQECACVRGQSVAALESGYALGVEDYHWKGLYGQLWWAANQLSAGYYGWKEGWLEEITLPNGAVFLPEEQSNPGGVALQVYFSRLWQAHDQSARMGAETWKTLHPDAFSEEDWHQALDPAAGYRQFHRALFGEQPEGSGPTLPPDLRQPELILPFEPGRLWSFTSGPHQAWEKVGSLAALDFAPASDQTGCVPSDAWVVAAGSGPVVRAGPGLVAQDLEGLLGADGREQTGWVLLYMHVAPHARIAPGVYLRAGDRIGHPSCEGGPATGTHLHLARKYNGEWLPAAGELPFVLDGWIAQAGPQPYLGRLVNGERVVEAHLYASAVSHIQRTPPAVEGTAGPK